MAESPFLGSIKEYILVRRYSRRTVDGLNVISFFMARDTRSGCQKHIWSSLYNQRGQSE